ncbi:dienelactone hydrolase family protein [Bradyrhizobium vignae]|uniref:Peptidase S9 prolyl oligopeptidase catalytic domain-containing protein n=1 Tax=Bradyrhizobium vignae TaxID=1549949 RepID=A0A2U3PVE0_9BRAD|nr:prolyl oligopeptidase family serine peptidase [Bradyrhizobium vignae]SPP93120.1 protein of unknown function [Bradyrhizobium vignae]
MTWARRRADDAYAALDWLIGQKIADPKRVYVLGRSNGATTTFIIMNRAIGDLHEHMFAGGFAMQPSCYLMKNVEFYAPVRLYLAEKDEATSPVLCRQMAESKRSIPVETVLWKGAHHSFEDHEPLHIFHGYHIDKMPRLRKAPSRRSLVHGLWFLPLRGTACTNVRNGCAP